MAFIQDTEGPKHSRNVENDITKEWSGRHSEGLNQSNASSYHCCNKDSRS